MKLKCCVSELQACSQSIEMATEPNWRRLSVAVRPTPLAVAGLGFCRSRLQATAQLMQVEVRALGVPNAPWRHQNGQHSPKTTPNVGLFLHTWRGSCDDVSVNIPILPAPKRLSTSHFTSMHTTESNLKILGINIWINQTVG